MFQCKNGKMRSLICKIIIPRLQKDGFPFRILEIDDQRYQIATESLLKALKDDDGEIRGDNISIDEQFAYYVPDLCIYLPDEDLVQAVETILNGGDADMYFKVEEDFGIGTKTSYYKDLPELCVARNINDCYTRLITIRMDSNIDSYKDEPIVKNTVAWIEDLFYFEMEPEVEITDADKRNLKVSICFGKYPKK